MWLILQMWKFQIQLGIDILNIQLDICPEWTPEDLIGGQ